MVRVIVLRCLAGAAAHEINDVLVGSVVMRQRVAQLYSCILGATIAKPPPPHSNKTLLPAYYVIVLLHDWNCKFRQFVDV